MPESRALMPDDEAVAAEPVDTFAAPAGTRGLVERLLARIPRRRMVEQLGWVTVSYGFVQAIRLVTNVVLARLLAPQIFGVMLLVNTLRTGFELLSDIGITANIVSNPQGSDPRFYNTAYTLQLIRGFALGLVVLAFAIPISHLYAGSALNQLVPWMPILFILSGLQAPSGILMVKEGRVQQYAQMEMVIATGSLAINVGLAIYTPTVWALFAGLALTTALHAGMTHYLMPRGMLRLQIDRDSMRQILSFGKWVFVSSLIYFLAMNYDRLYFAKVIPLAVLGVYGVARTFSDTAAQLVQRVGNMLIYPKIAASRQDGAALRAVLAPVRGRALLAIVALLALGIAGSDRVILILYDQRYHGAAFMLPVLMLGVWFSILATLGESVMMGTGRPAHAARANFAKFAFTCIGLPLALWWNGMAAALLVIAAGDLIRYASLAISERSQQMSFVRQDAALTLLLAAMAVGWRLVLTLIGIVPDPATWWAFGAGIHG